MAEKEPLESQLLARCQSELQAANQELEDFAYSISHDLRAPLRAIEGFSRVLLEDYRDGLDDDAKKYLNIIVSSAGKMQQLIDDLLVFSRLSKVPLTPAPLDMTDLAQAALREVRARQSDGDAQAVVDELLPAAGDAVLIKRAFLNLIDNAFKFSRGRPSPSIRVGSNRGADEAIYFVRDNGAGFEMAYAHKLFGVFQKLHSPEEYEGTGIGLAMVQRIVHRHHGRVWAESAPDHGATFYFSLPIATPCG